MTRIYTFVNQKGGVGKTTTAINLAGYLALAGKRALLVDIDPQANATSCLGIDKNRVQSGSYESLLALRPARESILHSPNLGLWLLPASPALAGAEVELVDQPERHLRLHVALEPLMPLYDYILVDCPPSLGLLTLNGMVAARDGLIIPIQCEYLALEGLGLLTGTLNRLRQAMRLRLEIRGLLLTMYDARANLSAQVAAEVQRHFSRQTFRSIIPRNVRLAEAPSHGLPISAYAPSSTGGLAYRALAEEILAQDEGSQDAGSRMQGAGCGKKEEGSAG